MLRSNERELKAIEKMLGEIRGGDEKDKSRIADLERRVIRLETKAFV